MTVTVKTQMMLAINKAKSKYLFIVLKLNFIYFVNYNTLSLIIKATKCLAGSILTKA